MNRDTRSSIVSLSFPLEVEDDWPPVAVESLPFQVTGEGHVALAPPLFVKDLSVGDVLEVTLDSVNGQVLSWRHVSRSARTTVWLLRLSTSETLDLVLAELRALRCNIAGARDLGVHAVDVPASVTIAAVDAALARLDIHSVAVAFPSMRHLERATATGLRPDDVPGDSRRVYRDPADAEEATLLERMRSDVAADVAAGLLGLVLGYSDYDRDLASCLANCESSDEELRGIAILCFGHIARIHGELPVDRVMPFIEKAMRDPSEFVRGHAHDAANDISMFVRGARGGAQAMSNLEPRVLAAVRAHLGTPMDHGFETADFIHAYGRASHALLYVSLYFPSLVEVDGSVLLRGSVDEDAAAERFRALKAARSRRAAERSFNLVEVPYLFGPQGRDLSDDEDLLFAEVIAASWRGWLANQFPERCFLVEVVTPEESGSVVSVHFCEDRDTDTENDQ